MILPSRSKLGHFWNNCKTRRRCGRPPYDRLLTNPVLRVDYRITVLRYERATTKPRSNVVRSEIKIRAV